MRTNNCNIGIDVMNHLVKEDNRLPDSWEMEIFFHKGNPKKYQVVAQKFFQDYLEIKTTKNTIHLIQRIHIS